MKKIIFKINRLFLHIILNLFYSSEVVINYIFLFEVFLMKLYTFLFLKRKILFLIINENIFRKNMLYTTMILRNALSLQIPKR